MGGRKRLTNEEIDKRLGDRSIVRVDGYTGRSIDKIKWKCLIDDHVWEASTANILNGKGCSKCSGNLPLTNEILDERVKDRNIKRLSGYSGKSSIKMKWKCTQDSCNHEWEATANDISNNRGCPKCAGNLPLTNEEIDRRLESRSIQRKSDYVNYITKMNLKCSTCEHEWKQSAQWLFHKTRRCGCPNCNKAGIREKEIKEYIETRISSSNKRVYFKYQKHLYDGRHFYVDFYIETETLKIVMEYNGKQHYEPVCFGGISLSRANKKFVKQQERDVLLEKTCKKLKVELVVIPYWLSDDEVKHIINRYI